ncbi:MAG: hypothetical protein HOU81_18600 [Hamadaea sp.]|uniref:hypothetical protein n=1 Tax=Hamadaea sp. TaxID=2024425 RepID=UPI0017BA05D3|nr:hypothetical protein [Hamadaea sp.]NUR72828.1 hypothetical protein [Hamadaea sp.]NUT20457.1 hypothetical protein [Hamadaea sp.]
MPRTARITAVALLAWALANALVLFFGRLPAGRQLADLNLRAAEALLIIVLVRVLTRRRPANPSSQAPADHATARRETLWLIAYGGSALVGGHLLARAMGWHPFSLHLAGSVVATHEHVAAAEAIAWAVYNLIAYAIVPLWYFRRRYSTRDLNLTSVDRRGDAQLIAIVLVVEAAVQIILLRPEIFDLNGRQLVLGLPLTFVLFLAGAVLPAMVFIYCLLLPRFLRLTGSPAVTMLLGGLAYAVMHVWDAWMVFTTPRDTVLSLALLLLTYVPPGMVKATLTLRTGNAWVHVWAYHALAPHTLLDTPNIVRTFGIR